MVLGPVGASVVPASVTVNLMRRARPGRLVGEGTLLKKGRRLTVSSPLSAQPYTWVGIFRWEPLS